MPHILVAAGIAACNYYNQGIKYPKRISNYTATVQNAQNPLTQFLHECVFTLDTAAAKYVVNSLFYSMLLLNCFCRHAKAELKRSTQVSDSGSFLQDKQTAFQRQHKDKTYTSTDIYRIYLAWAASKFIPQSECIKASTFSQGLSASVADKNKKRKGKDALTYIGLFVTRDGF